MPARRANASDWGRVEPLLRAMGGAEGQDSKELEAQFHRLSAADDHLLVVFAETGELLGYAWAQDYGPHLRSGQRTVRLNDLYVRPSHRRRGVGRALFAAVRGWAQDRRVRWLQWQSGTTTVAFYERLGLSPTPRDDAEHPFYEIDFQN